MPNLQNNDLRNKFDLFNTRGIHFMCVNIDSSLPKLEEMKKV